MTSKLEFTGEQFTPECEREIWYEHMHRYAFASALIDGGRVLDAACGEGYGSALLTRTADRVTGVDLSEDVIAHARKRYQAAKNLDFEVADCTRLPFDDGIFDTVVSFETLEHLNEQRALVAEFRRVLAPDGFLILSTPDKAVYRERFGIENAFHVHELYRGELEGLLGGQFPCVRLMGQKLLFHSAIWSFDGVERVALQRLDGDRLSRERKVSQPAMYLIALCAAEESALPLLGSDVWLFDDASESVYEHYLGEIRRNMAAGGIIEERDREIERLKERLGETRTRGAGWIQRLLGRK